MTRCSIEDVRPLDPRRWKAYLCPDPSRVSAVNALAGIKTKELDAMKNETVIQPTPEGPRAPGVFLYPEGGPAMAELSDALAKLQAITPRLNDATDAANGIFRATEEILAKVGIGIDALSDVGLLKTTETEASAPYAEEHLSLVYERIAGKYRIGFFVITKKFDSRMELTSDDLSASTPWDQAPREWKLTGVAKLPDLITRIASDAEKIAEEAEAATSTMKALLSDLQSSK